MNMQPIPSQQEQLCTRVMPGSADLFFEMWSTPEQISSWWVGTEMPIKTDYLDFRSGGEWVYTGNGHSHRVVFAQIQPDRIQLEGDLRVEVTIDRLDRNHTRVAFRRLDVRSRGQELLNQSVAKLEALLADAASLESPHRLILTLPSEHEIRSVRCFDARRGAIFEAFTTPQHLWVWQGPVTHRCLDCSYEPKVSGKWTLVHEDAEGNIWNFHGQIHEFIKDQRIVSTFSIDGAPGLDHVNSISFHEVANQTRVVIVSQFKNMSARDAMLELGKERGLAQAYHRLDALIDASRVAHRTSRTRSGRAYPG